MLVQALHAARLVIGSAARLQAAACAQQPPPRVHVPCTPTATRLPSAHIPPVCACRPACLLLQDPSLSPADATHYQQYLISATLIVCGISTAIQVTGIPRPYKRQWGAGILSVSGACGGGGAGGAASIACLAARPPAYQPARHPTRLQVMGVSFATFSPADKVLKTLIKEGNSFEEAYGMVLGTAALCALVPVAISFLPHRVIRKVFPPVVCGLVIMLIGINLCGVGIKVGGAAGGRAGGRAGGWVGSNGVAVLE